MLVKNVLSSTTGCDKLKKDYLKKHVAMQNHRAALEAASVQRDLQCALVTIYSRQGQGIGAVISTV